MISLVIAQRLREQAHLAAKPAGMSIAAGCAIAFACLF
jgi:hypothetical protein